MKKTMLTAFLAVIVAVGAYAGPSKDVKKVIIEPEVCNFRNMEFQIDGFYSGIFSSHGARVQTGSGGGFGLNFFFARYFGIGYEAFWTGSGRGEHFPTGGNFFLRYPICSWNLAPYMMVGGGAAWDGDAKGYGNVGGGLEYRFTPNIGVFVDSRYFYGAVRNLANLRSGVRIAF